VPGETIACYDGGANLDRRVSDVKGQFRFEGLPPGNYALEAIGVHANSGWGTAAADPGLEPGLLDPQEVFERRVNVRQGETTPWTIQLERDRLGAIEGVLTEDLPPSGSVDHVVLVDNQPRDVLGWQGHTEVSRRAFRIPNLHIGKLPRQPTRRRESWQRPLPRRAAVT
jgi:hypothetical protein